MRIYPDTRSKGLAKTFSKRALDLVICILSLPLLMILMLFVAAAIFIDTRGNTFFVQERVGKDNQTFRMIKFRTMYQKCVPEEQILFMKGFVGGKLGDRSIGKVYKPFKNEDITRVGRVLRKTSLDELPQMVNVFMGDMSLVGPRPNVPWEVEAYAEWHKKRLSVLPGITGLAQIRGRSGIAFDEIVRHDIEYIENQSLWLDSKIMLITLTSIIFQKGAL